MAFAPHYYDPAALLSGGEFEAAESYSEPIGKWREQGDEWNMPVLLGELAPAMPWRVPGSLWTRRSTPWMTTCFTGRRGSTRECTGLEYGRLEHLPQPTGNSRRHWPPSAPTLPLWQAPWSRSHLIPRAEAVWWNGHRGSMV